MDAVIFDGKEYLKASVVAEQFNYTQDYIGQLCRGKKVDARLVGRAWYINLESLQTHKKARYKDKAHEIVVKPDIQTEKPKYLTRIDVEPVLKKKTVKLMRNVGDSLGEFAVKYESDDYSLIPHVNRDSVQQTVSVLPAEAEELSVSNLKEAVLITNFKAEPLPEVYLKGKLRVDGLPEDLEEELKTDNQHTQEYQAHSVSAAQKYPEISSQHLEKTIDEDKKPIKIKLYRNNQDLRRTALVEDKPFHLKQPQPAIKKRPGIRPLPQTPGVKREVPVHAAVFEPKRQSAMVPNTETVIPFATFKAAFILLLASTATVSLLLIQNVTTVTQGSSLSTWLISFDQIHKIESLVNSK